MCNYIINIHTCGKIQGQLFIKDRNSFSLYLESYISIYTYTFFKCHTIKLLLGSNLKASNLRWNPKITLSV